MPRVMNRLPTASVAATLALTVTPRRAWPAPTQAAAPERGPVDRGDATVRQPAPVRRAER